jgi:hypothetical protein
MPVEGVAGDQEPTRKEKEGITPAKLGSEEECCEGQNQDRDGALEHDLVDPSDVGKNVSEGPKRGVVGSPRSRVEAQSMQGAPLKAVPKGKGAPVLNGVVEEESRTPHRQTGDETRKLAPGPVLSAKDSGGQNQESGPGEGRRVQGSDGGGQAKRKPCSCGQERSVS